MLNGGTFGIFATLDRGVEFLVFSLSMGGKVGDSRGVPGVMGKERVS